jgi:hypothetical protein
MVAALVGEDVFRDSYPKQEGLRRSRRLIHRLADAFFGESSKGLSTTAFVCHGSRLFGGKTFLQGLLAAPG